MKAKRDYINNRHVRLFMEEIAEYYDTREGVLLDSFIGVTKGGALVAAIATFETSQSSGLTIYTGESSDVWKIWEDFTVEYDKEG